MFRMPPSIEDLVYYDGPLMFTAKHPVTDKLIWVNQVDCWHDPDDREFLWMVIETTEKDIRQLIENKVTIYDFIKHKYVTCDFWLETAKSGKILEFRNVPLFVVHSDYFPKKDVYLCA